MDHWYENQWLCCYSQNYWWIKNKLQLQLFIVLLIVRAMNFRTEWGHKLYLTYRSDQRESSTHIYILFRIWFTWQYFNHFNQIIISVAINQIELVSKLHITGVSKKFLPVTEQERDSQTSEPFFFEHRSQSPFEKQKRKLIKSFHLECLTRCFHSFMLID